MHLDFELLSKFNGLHSLFQIERYSIPFHFLIVSLPFYCLMRDYTRRERGIKLHFTPVCTLARLSLFIYLIKGCLWYVGRKFFRRKNPQHVWATEAHFMIELWQWPSNKKTSQFTFSKIPMVCVSQPTTFFINILPRLLDHFFYHLSARILFCFFLCPVRKSQGPNDRRASKMI